MLKVTSMKFSKKKKKENEGTKGNTELTSNVGFKIIKAGDKNGES